MKQDFMSLKKYELMSNMHKKVYTTLNYLEHFPILASTVTGSTSIPASAFLVVILIGITSSTIGLKICATTAEIKKYN